MVAIMGTSTRRLVRQQKKKKNQVLHLLIIEYGTLEIICDPYLIEWVKKNTNTG
jgi:hypothetical protein